MKKFSHRQKIVFILLIGFVEAILLTVYRPTSSVPRETYLSQGITQGSIDIVEDGQQYWYSAENIVKQQVFSTRLSAPFTPSIFRTPGYPFFLAIGIALGLSMSYVLFLQACLGALIPVLIYRLLKELFSERTGFVVGCIFALLPLHWSVMNVLRTEILLQVFFLSAVICFIQSLKSFSWKWLIGSAILFGITSYVKPFLFFLFPIFILYALWVWRKTENISWQKAGKRLGFFVLTFALLLSPLLVRNVLTFHLFSISTVDKYTRFVYWIVPYDMLTQGRTRADVEHERLADVIQRYRLPPTTTIGDFEEEPYSSIGARYATDVIFHQIGLVKYATAHIRHALWFITASPIRQPLFNLNLLPEAWKNQSGAGITELVSKGKIGEALRVATSNGGLLVINIVDIGVLFLMYGGVVIAFWKRKKLEPVAFGFVCFSTIFFLYLFLANGFTYGGPRHRYPVEPFLYISSAIGWTIGWRLWRARRGEIQRVVDEVERP